MSKAADAVQYSNIQAGVEVGTLAMELAAELLTIKREIASRIQDLKRQMATAVKEVVQPTPQLVLLG
ncbi:hypothetical protein [Pseudacidovorax sp. 1753]|uniref:hypothetical protein n=1 Tax=Pseudacidovorax sp. 1753 TaxID=3156419 RepID=UPI0033922A13